MSKLLIPYGCKKGRYFAPIEVPNGDKCGCLCPGCGGQLRANHGKGRKRAYFSHQVNTECTAGYETAVHKVAKQIIQDAKSLLLPEFTISFPSLTLPSGKTFNRNPLVISDDSPTFGRVDVEKAVHPFRPDITAHTETGLIYIEIYVTSPISTEKSDYFSKENLVEIDLSQLDRDIVFDIERFKDVVLNQAVRNWMHCNWYNEEQNRALEQFHQEFEKQKAHELRLLDAQKQRREQFEQNRRKSRQPYLGALAELQVILTDAGLQHRVNMLSQHSKEKINKAQAFLGFSDGWPDPIGHYTVNSWIFNEHWIVWQSYIYASYIKNKSSGYILDAIQIKKDVINRYGILDCVYLLNNAKHAGKRQGRARETYYAETGAWFFSDSENKAIPSPYVSIIQFLEELTRLNILRTGSSGHLFSVCQNNLLEAQKERLMQRIALEMENKKKRMLAKKQAASEAKEREKRQAEERLKDERVRKAHAELSKQRMQKRIRKITEEVAELFEKGVRVGFRCNWCSSIKDRCDQACNYCGKVHYEPVEIDRAFVDTLEHRLICDPRVDR